ncbi:MAG: ABC transporter permease [Candidatus Nanopelagicales bacterium]
MTGRAQGQRTRLAVPVFLAIPAAIAMAFLVIPLVGLLVMTPWGDLMGLLGQEQTQQALRLSIITSLSATGIALILGVPLAWILARVPFRGRSLVRVLVLLPLVLPPVVGGTALLAALGRRGIIGAPLEALTGITLPFSMTAVIIAETFVAMPFLIITVEGALRGMDQRFEEAASTLGASRARVLFRITLPLVLPGIVAGATLAWARALGEFGATITFAGNFPGRTQTLPLAVYSLLETDRDAAIALSVVLLLVCVMVLLALREQWLRPGAQR